MLSAPPDALHNHPDTYWCAECRSFTLDCAHLVEPLDAPAFRTRDSIVTEFRWTGGVLQLRMNNGEGYQHFGVPQRVAVEFVRKPEVGDLRAYRFKRVRGRVA